MVKNNNNGNGQLDDAAIEELKKFIHSPDTTDKAFKNQDTLNAIRLVILSDPDILDNAMRYDIPSNRMILGLAVSLQQCQEHHYAGGENFYKMLLGLMPSRHGKRVDQLIEAIVGERKWKEQSAQNGIANKIKGWVTGQQ